MLVNGLRVLGVGAGFGIGAVSITRQFDTDSKVGHLFLATVAASVLTSYSLKGVLPDLIGRFKWLEKAALPLGCVLGALVIDLCHGEAQYKVLRKDNSSKHVFSHYETVNFTGGVIFFAGFLLSGALVRHGIRYQFPHLLELLPRHLATGVIGGYVAGRGLLQLASGSGERGTVEGHANVMMLWLASAICFGAATIAMDYFSAASLQFGVNLLTTRFSPA